MYPSFDNQKIILITGAASSGKSEFAEVLAQRTHKPVTYIATAKIDSSDREWQARILQHQQRRPASWQTATVDVDLSSYLKKALESECLLIDSLGTWVANSIESTESNWQQIQAKLLSSLQATPATVILVSEETGWGVVPAYPMGRLFRDRLGSLSRQISNLADITYLVAGGHVIELSMIGEPLNKYGI